MKMINKMGLAASLILASSLASADNSINLGNLTSTGSEVYVELSMNGGYDVVGSFLDTFSFTLDAGNTFAAFASSTSLTFDKISLASVDGQTGGLFGIFSYATTELGAISGPATPVFLDAGDYSLTIAGTTTFNSEGYTLDTVSAVPEPSSIALMLGGLGLVGFMAARRKKA